jgi:hypothetical protein
MRVLNDRSEVPAPGICFVCETAPQGRAVDTLQNFTPGFVSPIAGAKVLCEGCVAAAARAFGYVSDAEAVARDEAAVRAEVRLVAVVDHVRAFARRVVDGELEAVADVAEAPRDAEPVEVVVPDLVAAQAELADAEQAEPNAVSVPNAQVVAPKRSRKADADS